MKTPAMKTPDDMLDVLKERFFSYYDTAIPVADEALAKERRSLLAEDKAVFQDVWLEQLHTYASTEHNLAESCQLSGAPNELVDLVSSTLFSSATGPVHLYEHQHDTLIQTLAGKDVVVASGTGSGKTEAFLVPLMARLVAESANWTTGAAPSPDAVPWWEREDGRWEPHRIDHAGRPAAVRAIVLYPMNALVEDQLIRLRRAFDSPAAEQWYTNNRHGQRFYFGRYTSQAIGRGDAPYGKPTTTERKLLRRATDRHLELVRAIDNGTAEPGTRHFLPRPGGSEMLLRWDMQVTPPDVLVTNYSMLNVMLMRDREQAMFEATRSWLAADPTHVLTLVVDELHLYRGVSGTEVAYLLRKLLHRLGLSAESPQLSIITATASIDMSRPRDRKFLAEFFNRPDDRFVAVKGRLTTCAEPRDLSAALPALTAAADAQSAEAALRQHRVAEAVAAATRTEDGRYQAVSSTALSRTLFPTLAEPEARSALNTIIETAITAERRSPLRFRSHLFVRVPTGVWACANRNCAALQPSDNGRVVGKLYSQPQFRCQCGGRILELITCQTCGEVALGGYRSGSGSDSYLVAAVAALELLPDRVNLARTFGNYGLYWPTPPSDTTASTHGQFKVAFKRASLDPFSGKLSIPDPRRSNGAEGGTYVIVGDGADESDAFPSECPGCGDNWNEFNPTRALEDPEKARSPLRAMGTGYDKTNQVLVDGLLDSIERRKLVLFADSRQDAAKASAGIERAHYHDLVRELVIAALGSGHPLQEAIPYLSREKRSEPGKKAAARLRKLAPDDYVLLSTEYEDLNAVERARVDELRCRAKDNVWSVRELARALFPELLSLGVNPAGPDDTFQRTNPPRPGNGPRPTKRPWTALVDWTRCVAWPDERLSADELQLLTDIRRGLEAEISLCVFAGGGRDLESLGLARAGYRGVSLLPGGDFNETLSVVVRILGQRKWVAGIHTAEGKETDGDDAPRFIKAYLDRAGVAVAKVADHLSAVANRWLLDPDRILLAPPGEKAYECSRCTRRFLHPAGDACFGRGCTLRPLKLVRPEDPAKRSYYALIANTGRPPMRLHCEELTGQTAREVAADRQARFQEVFLGGDVNEVPLVDGVDLLSVTTTMEAGVDIGDLQAVVLSNMPPMRFNYQQRVGRAGRRGDPIATSLTICRGARSHDDYYFMHPDRITNDIPPPPYVDLERTEVLLRSVVAETLRLALTQAAPADVDRGSNIHGQFGLVADWSRMRPDVEQWLQSHHRDVRSLVDALTDSPEQRAASISYVLGGEMLQAVDLACVDKLGDPDLSQRLAERGVLPMFGFPSQSRYLFHDWPTKKLRGEWPPKHTISRSLDMAISSFAPGATVVKDKRLHTVLGVADFMAQGDQQVQTTKDPLGPMWQIGLCGSCQGIDVSPRDTCQVCGAAQNNDDARAFRVVCVAEPLGFITDLQGQDFTGTTDRAGHSAYPRIDETMGPLSVTSLPGGATVRQGRVRRIMVNDNNGRLFRFTKMGASNVKYGRVCIDVVDKYKANRNVFTPKLSPVDDYDSVALGARQVTDAALFRLPHQGLRPTKLEHRAAAISGAFLLRRIAASHLDVEPDELEAGLHVSDGDDGPVLEVFLADTADNGAGYTAHLIRPEVWGELAKTARHHLRDLAVHMNNGSPCDSSCYDCLRDYRNQGYHSLLDWRLASRIVAELFDVKYEETNPVNPHEIAQRYANTFTSSASGWSYETRHDLPVLISRDETVAMIVTGALDDVEAPGEQLAEVLVELTEDDGYDLQSPDAEPARLLVAVSVYELLRRPGDVESRLRGRRT